MGPFLFSGRPIIFDPHDVQPKQFTIMEGNVLDTNAFDTGRKWVSGGNTYRIFRKKVVIGALPNAGTKNVAHGQLNDTIAPIDPAKMVRLVSFWASKGDASAALTAMTALASVSVTATNVVVVTGADQSLYTSCEVVLEWAA